jgi:hypothetical protein
MATTTMIGPNLDRSLTDETTRPAATRRPIALTDDQLDIIRRAAQPLHPQDRSAYLETVASLLAGHEIGDGSVARAVAAAQRHYRNPPDLSRGHHVPRWARRDGGIRAKATAD